MICFSCHRGCIGHKWYAFKTLDLKTINVLPMFTGCFHLYLRMTMKSMWSPLRWELAMSAWQIIWLGAKGPMDIFDTMHKSSEWGFGTVWTSMLYIPGNRSEPKGAEKCQAFISLSWYLWMNSYSIVDHGHIRLLSHVIGKSTSSGSSSAKWVSAQGQKHSQRADNTDSTKGWFGCVLRHCSNSLIFIGVMILNNLE